ncbi:MAG: helix-turn-helix domain-containing protein [Actinomycetota bacterium]|nr:helix-turn-helix domain-containing protein [Actinomycetota bacterium]
MDVAADNRTIGRRLRQIRYARGKSLRVIAGLAGISTSSLSRIERGERAFDNRSETVALANALQIAPSAARPPRIGTPRSPWVWPCGVVCICWSPRVRLTSHRLSWTRSLCR